MQSHQRTSGTCARWPAVLLRSRHLCCTDPMVPPSATLPSLLAPPPRALRRRQQKTEATGALWALAHSSPLRYAINVRDAAVCTKAFIRSHPQPTPQAAAASQLHRRQQTSRGTVHDLRSGCTTCGRVGLPAVGLHGRRRAKGSARARRSNQKH